jgi:hypothetical protein
MPHTHSRRVQVASLVLWRCGHALCTGRWRARLLPAGRPRRSSCTLQPFARTRCRRPHSTAPLPRLPPPSARRQPPRFWTVEDWRNDERRSSRQGGIEPGAQDLTPVLDHGAQLGHLGCRVGRGRGDSILFRREIDRPAIWCQFVFNLYFLNTYTRNTLYI